MKTKILIMALAVLLVLSMASVSAKNITNFAFVLPPENFTAGTLTSFVFSFDYPNIIENSPDSPLVIQVNITSLNSDYPVWKGDFMMDGLIKRFWLSGLFGNLFYRDTILLECFENSPLTINHPQGPTTLNVPNGTFYCYNINYENLDLGEHDEVNLTLISHPALYPGEYRISVQLFDVVDLEGPFVEILNKNYFENNFFTRGSYFEVEANVSDDVGIDSCWGVIYNNGEEFNYTFAGIYLLNESKCYVPGIIPINILGGNHTLKVFVQDTSGNLGEDETTIKIDITAPRIKLIQPVEGVYSEIIPVELNVTDNESGVDEDSVQVRLREIVNGTTICPETGGPIGNFSCTTTPWINLTLNQTSSLFEVDINSIEYNLTSGEYWLDARASDILGNKAKWIA